MLTDQMTDADKDSQMQFFSAPSLRLAGLFSRSMILQRRKPVPVWGWTAPGRKVFCSIGGTQAVTFAGNDGKFFLKLPPMETAQNLTMTVSDGSNSCTVEDVAIGEVFAVSGQSNMEFDLARVPEDEVYTPKYPVRVFRVKPAGIPCRVSDVAGQWHDSTYRKGISAVAFFFAAKVAEELKIPVGVLDVSRGGVGAETFCSEYYLAKDPFYRELLKKYEAERFLPEKNPEPSTDALGGGVRLQRRIRLFNPEVPLLAGHLVNWDQPGYDDSNWDTQDLPDSWSIAGHPHTGVFLYRKKVTLPPGFTGKELLLSLGACDRADETMVNGTLVGKTGKANQLAHWDTIRQYTIPADLTRNGEVVIAVKVSNFCSICTFGGMVGPDFQMFIACGEEKISLCGDWKIAEAFDSGCSSMDDMILDGAGETKSFHMLYDNCVYPTAPYAVNAFLWYQGEANALSIAERYDNLQAGVIHSFREAWCDPELPFIVFNLPGYQREHLYSAYSKLAVIRDSQLRVTLRETGYPPVNICDCGEPWEIHPPRKKIPGERAADFYLALKNNQPVPCGAFLTSVKRITARKLHLIFDTGASALADVPENPGIAGIDCKANIFALDAVKIAPDTLEVDLPDPGIDCLAYGWCENPGGCKLRSENKLPVFPFKYHL